MASMNGCPYTKVACFSLSISPPWAMSTLVMSPLTLSRQRQSPSSLNQRLAVFLRGAFILFFLLTTVAATPTSGCGCDLPVGQSPGAPSVQVPFQQSSGVNRTYLIHIPKNYNQNTPAPLVLNFHGRGRNNIYQEFLTGFSRPDWNPNAIVVYPQGIKDRWQGDPESLNVDDVGFVSDLISSISHKYCLDSKRIYATAKSNGGSLVNQLACDFRLSTQIAAFAPVSAALYLPGVSEKECSDYIRRSASFPCSPGRIEIPILEFHGFEDDTIPLEYAPGTKNEGIITHYAIKNWSHDWPSRNSTVDTLKTTSIDATPMIMAFFNKHVL
ncbi:Feruloyl esterase B [Golovinomyces cichoracearum]|uniref:feruloyl esterase n=1 Tax=Golovinomyces cichoracearum TaxID=62708 RepID=A0A420IZZ9_9PEZI|nr:Feruloyl esterase B [Golovinomyces cichoracearum]